MQKVLGGSLDLQTMNEQGVAKPGRPGHRIDPARLEADGVAIVGSDGHPDYPATVGHNMGIALGGKDKESLTKIFNGLADGGRIQMPLTRQLSGIEVGWLKDRFGILWTVSIDKA